MFVELLKRRRSTRVFLKKAVEKSKIDYLIECALLAPSSRSRRPWEFVIVDDPNLLAQLATCREHGSSFLANAPLGIVVVADPDKCDVWIEDASIVAIFLQLAAESIGLGSCWIQVRKRFKSDGEQAEDYIKKLLNVPNEYHVECIIAVGYKEELTDIQSEDYKLLEKVHYNKY
jgi:nitroreductase